MSYGVNAKLMKIEIILYSKSLGGTFCYTEFEHGSSMIYSFKKPNENAAVQLMKNVALLL